MDYNNKSTSNITLEEKQNIMNELKNEIKNFIGLLIDFNDTKINDTNKIIKTDLFSVQIGTDNPDKKDEIIKSAIDNKMSFANFSNCLTIIKNFYNISEQTNILIKKIEFDPKTDITKFNDTISSKLVSFEFINPLNKEKLNTSICQSILTSLSIPFKKSEKINNEMYHKADIIKNIIDLYDSKSPGYHSRCFKTTQFDTGADVSLNYKRTNMFQNLTISCSEGCIYEGLDINNYVKCNCNTTGKGEISNTGNEEIFDPLPKMNYDIFWCYYETFHDVFSFI